MAERQQQLTTLEQQLLRYAIAHEDEIGLSAANIREAITKGESEVEGSGSISKGTVISEILVVKERLTGGLSAAEIKLGKQVIAAKLEKLGASAPDVNDLFPKD